MNTRFIAFLLPCIAVGQSVTAYADTVNQLLSYTCDQKADQIVLDMQSASNEAGAALIKNKGPNAWDPWSLLATGGREEELVTGLHLVHRICTLSDGHYVVTLTPLPGNANLLGHCGQTITANVRVTLRGRVLLSESFGNDCTQPQSVTYSEMSVTAKGHKVDLTQDN